MSAKKGNNNELLFTQSSSIQIREKIKELWKFLDSQSNFEPYKPLQSRNKSSLESSTHDQVCKLSKSFEESISGEDTSLSLISPSQDEIPDNQMIWYHGLQFFQQIGLDKAVLSKTKCKFCLAEKDFQNLNYTDTLSQTYDELKAEMASFDERLGDRQVDVSESSGN